MNPLVSIGIPAYNHEKYVQTCINSVIAQDYHPMELIVVDDGSTDRTWERICLLREACERRFVRVVMERQEHRGRIETFSRLCESAGGEFYGEIASDDFYLPGAISKLVAAVMAREDIGVAVGRNRLVDGNGRTCYWDRHRNVVYDRARAKYRSFDEWIEWCSGVKMGGDDFGSYRKMLSGNHVPNGAIKRMSAVRATNAYDIRAPLEDWWFHLQLSKVARYAYVNDEVFAYRWHGNNFSVCRQMDNWRDERATLLLEERLSGLKVNNARGLIVKYFPLGLRYLSSQLRIWARAPFEMRMRG